MFATFVTLTVISFAVAGLRDLLRHDGAKILAAIQGRSWVAEAGPSCPVVVRFNSLRMAAEPAWPELRAAA